MWPLNDEPVNRCFGIDCYQIGDTIVEEKNMPNIKFKEFLRKVN